MSDSIEDTLKMNRNRIEVLSISDSDSIANPFSLDQDTSSLGSVQRQTSPCIKYPAQISFYANISPLLTSMKIFGMYLDPAFSCDSVGEYNEKSPKSPNCTKKGKSQKRRGLSLSYVYACCVLVMMWLNVVRMFSMFEPSDKLDSHLLTKIVAHIWVLVCAVMQTVLLTASRSGLLKLILDELAERSERSESDANSKVDHQIDGVDTVNNTGQDKNEKPEKQLPPPDSTPPYTSPVWATSATDYNIVVNISSLNSETPQSNRYTLVAWGVLISNTIFFGYILLSTSIFDMTIAPFTTYILHDNTLAARIVYIFIMIYFSAAWSFPPAITCFISLCLSKEFEKVDHELKNAVNLDSKCTEDRGGRLMGVIERFRMRHHKISKLVEKTDHCLWLCNGMNVVGHIAVATVMTYVVFFCPDFRVSILVTITGCFWILAAVAQLTVIGTASIAVHNAVRD